MKTPVAVALIVVGGFLILGPAVFDHLARAQLVTAMTAQKLTSINLEPAPMTSVYRFGWWLVGAVMVAAAVILSRNSKPER